MDLWVVDIRRFSDLHKDRNWVYERTLEAYGKHYTIGFPHEEYESGRPRIVSPLYERLKKLNACFGSKLGWERPNWFAAVGTEPKDIYSMGRQNWFDAVGEEHRAVRERVGVFDQSSFAKYRAARQGCRRGALLDLRQRSRACGWAAHLHADAQFARRHRMRSHRRAPRRRSFLYRHRHRLPHP